MSSVLVFAGLAGSQASAQAVSARTLLTPDDPLIEPRPLLWRTITVRGTVDRILEDQAFTLRSRSIKQGLLVVYSSSTKSHTTLQVGQEVEVRGTVRILSRKEVARLAQVIGLGLTYDGRPAGHGNHPYILAYEIRTGERVEDSNS